MVVNFSSLTPLADIHIYFLKLGIPPWNFPVISSTEVYGFFCFLKKPIFRSLLYITYKIQNINSYNLMLLDIFDDFIIWKFGLDVDSFLLVDDVLKYVVGIDETDILLYINFLHIYNFCITPIKFPGNLFHCSLPLKNTRLFLNIWHTP